MKDETVKIRISKDVKDVLLAVAVKRDVPISQIVREAIREKIADFADEEETRDEYEAEVLADFRTRESAKQTAAT